MFYIAETEYLAARLEAERRDAIATRNALLGVPAWKPRWPFARAAARPLPATIEVRRQVQAIQADNLRKAA